MSSNHKKMDRTVEGRLSGADTRTKMTIERLRLGIGEYILTAAALGRIAPVDVPCPPLSEWGQPPLPNPDRLRLCASRTYGSLLACVAGEFAQVQAALPPRQSPAQEGDNMADVPS